LTFKGGSKAGDKKDKKEKKSKKDKGKEKEEPADDIAAMNALRASLGMAPLKP
jgi:hypothetical protein